MLLVWIQTHDPCKSRAVSYQPDYRGFPVARGSLNHNVLAAGTATIKEMSNLHHGYKNIYPDAN